MGLGGIQASFVIFRDEAEIHLMRRWNAAVIRSKPRAGAFLSSMYKQREKWIELSCPGTAVTYDTQRHRDGETATSDKLPFVGPPPPDTRFGSLVGMTAQSQPQCARTFVFHVTE